MIFSVICTKTMVYQVVVGELETICEGLVNGLEDLEIRGQLLLFG